MGVGLWCADAVAYVPHALRQQHILFSGSARGGMGEDGSQPHKNYNAVPTIPKSSAHKIGRARLRHRTPNPKFISKPLKTVRFGDLGVGGPCS